jgi:hypothetical protein
MNSARKITCLLVVLLLSVAAGRTAQVRVEWPETRNATEIMSRPEALQAGFVKAVNEASKDILPGVLEPEREILLNEYLASRAGDYVLSYSEIGVERDPLRTLILDVDVNRPALKRTLKKLGIFYTVDEPQSFDLRFSGGAQAFWEDLGRLTTLSGLTIQDGAEPRLRLSLGDNATLTGMLSAGEREWVSRSKDVEKLWVELWGKWFTRPEAEAGVFQESVLVITGWYATDGVRDFDHRLATWEQEVESAVLTEVKMLPEGITARWTIRTLDKDALTERLAAYLTDRGLSYDFEDVAAEEPQPAETNIENPESG